MKHLAIMNKLALEAILSGRKIIETRFSKHRIPPFGLVKSGDIVYMKPPGEEIVGQFKVKKVFNFEGLEEKDIEDIFSKYGKKISSGDKTEDERYYQEKKSCFFGTLIFILESERFITSPVRIKKKDLRGWVVLAGKA